MVSIFRKSIMIFIAAAALLTSGASVCMAAEEPEPEEPVVAFISEDMNLDVTEDNKTIEVKNAEEAETAAIKRLKVKKVIYDIDKNLVTFKFNQPVKYKKLKVTINYKNGKNMVKKVKKKGKKYLTVKVKKLKYGRKYKYKLKGIRRYGSKIELPLIGSFRAIE